MTGKKVSLFLKTALVTAALVFAPGVSLALDHDGDGQGDMTVFRPESAITPGTWFVNSSALDGTLLYQWGLAGDYPVQAFYSGGNGADLGVWRPTDGVWYLRYFNAGLTFPTAEAFQWGGLPGDSPHPCDFDGDDRADLVIFRDPIGTWYVRNSDGGAEAYDNFTVQQWGLPGDVAVPADYDLDGKCDYAVFRQGTWYIILSSTDGAQAATIAWGAEGDIPVPGQYDADNILDFAVYREGGAQGPLWVIRRSTLAGLTYRVIQWGLVGDVPVPGDYTGDGKTDIAVYRPSTGIWYILTSESNYATAVGQQFGLSGDIPVGDRRGSDPD